MKIGERSQSLVGDARKSFKVSAQTVVVFTVVIFAALLPILLSGDTYWMAVATQCLIYGLAAVALNLVVGYGGMISLAQAAILAVGAYTATLLLIHVEVMPFPVELLAAGLVAGILGFVLGFPASRLHGLYFALVTLGVGVAIPQFITNIDGLTGGSEGLLVPRTVFLGLDSESTTDFYYLALITVAICLGAIFNILDSNSGRAFMATRDREDAASAMGVDSGKIKVVLFTTSSFFVGIAGALYAHYSILVAPSSFPLSLSLYFLAAVVVGGLASVWGSVLAAILLVLVATVTSDLGGFAPVVIGATVIMVLLIDPGGLVSIYRRVIGLPARRRRKAASADGSLRGSRHA